MTQRPTSIGRSLSTPFARITQLRPEGHRCRTRGGGTNKQQRSSLEPGAWSQTSIVLPELSGRFALRADIWHLARKRSQQMMIDNWSPARAEERKTWKANRGMVSSPSMRPLYEWDAVFDAPFVLEACIRGRFLSGLSPAPSQDASRLLRYRSPSNSCWTRTSTPSRSPVSNKNHHVVVEDAEELVPIASRLSRPALLGCNPIANGGGVVRTWALDVDDWKHGAMFERHRA